MKGRYKCENCFNQRTNHLPNYIPKCCGKEMALIKTEEELKNV